MAGSSSRSSEVAPASTACNKRTQVLVACEACRQKKAKCDSALPVCGRCRARGLECLRETEPDESRAVARKRRYDVAQSENEVHKQLYEFLQRLPDDEIPGILERIRQQYSASEVLDFARQQSVLIRRHLPKPSGDSAMKAIDAHILREAQIKVPARPWTTVAGDGMVSHLISLFFELEQVFHEPYIVREPFLQDMVAADVKTARWCTPLLVNTICALSCFLSNYSTIHLKPNEGLLRYRFINEARRLLKDEAGRRSLPTTQSLALMHLYYCGAAEDRGGAVYRFAAAEMFRVQRLGDVIPEHNTGDEWEEEFKKAHSHAVWALFCQETLSAFAYLQPSLIRPPQIPRHFAEGLNDDDDTTVESVLNAQCSLMETFYAISHLRAVGSPDDCKMRLKLYDDLLEWFQKLPPRAKYEPRMIRHYHAMRTLFYFGTIVLFRPVRTISNSYLQSSKDPTETCLASCESMMAELDEWEKVYPRDFDPSMCTTIFAHYIMAFTLLPLLDREKRSHPLVIRSCKFFYNTSRHWPATATMLQGIDASFRLAGIALPSECLRFLPSYQSSKAEAGDLATSWVIPHPTDGNLNSDGPSIELGNLISRYCAMSLAYEAPA